MHIPDDYDQEYAAMDAAEFEPYRCQRCTKSLADVGDDYCLSCRAAIDGEELGEVAS